VYVLLIAAFVPPRPVLPGIQAFNLHGLVLWSIYVLSLAAAMLVALLLRKSVVRGPAQPLILELPPYRLPFWRNVLAAMWSRGRLFLTQAGTIILAMNIVLWFLLAFPSDPPLSGEYATMRAEASRVLVGDELEQRLGELDRLEASERLSRSFAGRLGRVLEPLIEPLGFDWKIGIGIIGSLAAREVFISTLAVVYGVEQKDETGHSLVSKLRSEFGVLTGLSIIIFFLLSCQCMATVAVMRREANSWGWALFLYAYMTLLAYLVCLVFYQVTSKLWPHLA
jgi:ferrous iron transport protein B